MRSSPELFGEEEEDDSEYREVLSLEGEPLSAQRALHDHASVDVSTPTANTTESATNSANEQLQYTAVTTQAATSRGHNGSNPSASPPISRLGLNAHKAGMEDLDKAKINQIILEASKGSKFYENEVKQEKQVTKRVNWMLEKRRKITPAMIASALKAVDREVDALEASRELGHIVVHVDMDAFYAAVEMRDNPRLKDVPMAVGGWSMLVSEGEGGGGEREKPLTHKQSPLTVIYTKN